ncbi:glycosyltransferase [Cellulomonas septica]|uniref:Glycosyltransferase n=1 Tax=Cellulomonas septica TaxID=285080 RepID=A0ABX1K2H1_9CELL|nr:glycosyltransferase [Cellulomonas septica]
MLIFLLQVRDLLSDAPFEIYLFALFTALVWLIWLVKVVLSARYRTWTEPCHATTSVVIPVVDEPLDLFHDVLRRITEQQPHEVVVVINGPRNTALESVCDDFPQVRRIWTPVAGKRNAVAIGVEVSTGEIIALVDSDTIWTPHTLTELVKPFNDPKVGGVTTRQRILDPRRKFITRWADWLENSRALYAMPAQSALGQVGCLPGRTIAFRRDVLVRAMPQFLGEEFLGIFLEVSDDRTLTNLTLKQGYRTVYQHTSLVYTDAPLRLRKMAKQQLRWARGSQYNTLRMLPWMTGHAPVLGFFFVMDILLPFLLLGTWAGGLYRTLTQSGYNFYKPLLELRPGWQGVLLLVGLVVAASWLSMALRQMRHLREVPRDLLLLPAYIVFSTFFLMPIRLLGFFRMAHVASWGTRAHAYSADTSDGVLDVAEDALRTDAAPPAIDTALPSVGDTPPSGVPVAGAGHGPHAATRTAPDTRAARRTETLTYVRTQPAPPARRRRLNPKAAVPYLLGGALLSVEALAYVL